MTIFALLSMVMVLETLFIVLEASRVMELKRISKLQSELATESVFANYCSPLWEEYRLLGFDIGNAEEKILRAANGRVVSQGFHLLNFQVETMSMDGYTLITDGKGQAFLNAVCCYMKDNLSYETAKVMYSQYKSFANLSKEVDVDLSKIDDAMDALEKDASDSKETSSAGSGKKQGKASVNKKTKTLLDEGKQIRDAGVLKYVVKDTKDLSQKKVSLDDVVSKRALAVGVHAKTRPMDWMEKVLLQQYLLSYMSFYGEEKDNRALDYELEYILAGKSNDLDNLKSILYKIFLFRQAANTLHILQSTVKMTEIKAIALATSAITLSPELYDVVKIGLVTSWALGESILDCRAIFQGKKVPLIKSESSWTLDLWNIPSAASDDFTAKESKHGFGYKEYLGVLIFFQTDEVLAMRAMDAQELTIRSWNGYEQFYMDQMATELECNFTYLYKPIFQIFNTLPVEEDFTEKISHKVKYKYAK